ncbi:MAG: hypothetical protein ACJA1R_003102, partial [Flavobacteriales bacterium]
MPPRRANLAPAHHLLRSTPRQVKRHPMSAGFRSFILRSFLVAAACLSSAPAWAVDGLTPNGELPEWLRFQFDLDEGGQVRDDRARWFVLPGVGYTSDTLVAFSLAGLVQWRMPSSLAESSAPSRVTGVGIYTTNRQWRSR